MKHEIDEILTAKANAGVCPVLRELGIRLNDGPWWESEAERTSVLAPLLTLAGDAVAKRRAKHAKRRAEHAAHVALREFAPTALEATADSLAERGIADHAAILRQHAVGLRRRPSAEAAYAAAGAASAASSIHAYDGVVCAAIAADAAETAASADVSAASVVDAAVAAANASDADTRKAIRDRLIKLIDECIEIC